jgi:hypothetical protein
MQIRKSKVYIRRKRKGEESPFNEYEVLVRQPEQCNGRSDLKVNSSDQLVETRSIAFVHAFSKLSLLLNEKT